MSHQASRKVHIRNHYSEQEMNDDVDVILDLYNEGRANLDQVAAAINDVRKHRDKQFAITPEMHEAATDDWEHVQAEPWDWKEKGQ